MDRWKMGEDVYASGVKGRDDSGKKRRARVSLTA